MFRALTRIRPVLLAALALLLAAAEARAQSGTLALAPTQADATLSPLTLGFDRWLSGQLEESGLATAALEGAGDLPQTLASAAQQEFAHVLVPRLTARDDSASVQLLLYDPGSTTPLIGVQRSAPLAELGRAAADVLGRLAPQIGGSPEHDPTPPLLEDLASTSQALRARRAGDLPAAFRAVQSKLSPTAMALREEIVAEGRRSRTAVVTRARMLVAFGDPTTAWGLIGRSARAELSKSAPDPALLSAAGEVMLAQDAVGQARRYFGRALEVEPDQLTANTGMAHVLEREGDLDAARDAMARATKLDPQSAYLAEELARIEQDAVRSATYWIDAGRRSAWWLDARRARTHFETAEAVDPDVAAQASAELGALELRLGRRQEARTAYLRALDGGVRTPTVLTALGRIDYGMGNASAAEQHLRAALEIQPKHPGALRELGVLYVETKRPAEAVPLLQKASKVDPTDSRTRIKLSHALRATGNIDEALALMSGKRGEAPALELAEFASIQAERGDLDAARDSLGAAVALAPGDASLRRQLADVLAKAGDAAAAAAERQLANTLEPAGENDGTRAQRRIASVQSLDDLVMSFAVRVARPESRRIAILGVREPKDWKSRLQRIVRPRSPDLDAIRAGIEASIETRFENARVSPESVDGLALHVDRLFEFESDHSLDAETIATLNQVLAADGAFATRLITREVAADDPLCGAGAFGVEMRLLMGNDVETASILSNFDCLDGGFEAYGRWNFVALALYAALLLLVAWPLIRGWGQIVVSIQLPERTRGFFSIHVTRRPDQVKREVNEKTNREKSKGNRFDFLKRYHRHMAGARTTFRMIPARQHHYTVTVSGPLKDARGEEVIGHFLEEQRVTVERRRASTLTFDFRPKEVAVEVTVLSGERPAKGARVAVMGDPSSLRYAREGVSYHYLGLGSYTILVGTHDSAAQFDVEISSLDAAIQLQVDMSQEAGMVFRECPEAVETYLQSDFDSAARSLDAAGNQRGAHLLRAEFYRQQGRTDEAARELEAAGQIHDAAAVRAGGQDLEGGAALYEEAGDIGQAARAYHQAGRFEEAARCYEQVYDYGNALECWREVGDTEREIAMLEKLGEYMDAAQMAKELGDRERAVQNLQFIESRHYQYGDACRIIAELASEDGNHDVAVAKFEEALSSTGLENASSETLESYAGVLERAGRVREALSAWQAIRRQDATRTDVATRIQALEARLAESSGRTQQMPTVPVAAPPPESRYELLEEIGRGGMGVVYKARDKRLGRVVALKRLPENLRDHPAAVELFDREARAAAALNHVNIVTVFDAGEEDGHYFITMELLEGRTLNSILERSGRVSVADTMRLAVQICAGLNYAHERKIVHRDIKTANLFFTRDQVVKIMDFGIAKSMEEVRRSTTVVGGTPYYMAPEQAKGDTVDHRADLYALGVTLFQLSTGQLPFQDGDITYRHCHEEPPDPREINVNLDADFAQLILSLLKKSPDDRPPTAAALGARLSELLAQLS